MPQRTFTSPSGRVWIAAEVELPRSSAADAAQHILRFSSGDLALDLDDWPADWAALPEEALVHLVRAARPPYLGLPDRRSLQRPH